VPKRQVARVALHDDETLVLLICRSELIDGDPLRERQKAALRCAFGDMKWEVPEILDRMDEVDDIYFDRVSQIHLTRWSLGRVAVIGDAAACASLLAGEGTGLAMIEAYVLAGELHRAGGDIVRALAAFEARLRSFVTTKQKTALRFRNFFAPRIELMLRVRNVAVATLSIPFFANRLIGSRTLTAGSRGVNDPPGARLGSDRARRRGVVHATVHHQPTPDGRHNAPPFKRAFDALDRRSRGPSGGKARVSAGDALFV
jgi:2-polyprenyl-6-methoxyphenol hydroxylase-like FAD-dependent oxidoreductase